MASKNNDHTTRKFQGHSIAWLAALCLSAATVHLVRRAARKFSFAGKTVLITGGSRGLGLAIARQLARERANLVLLARNLDELNRAAEELRQYPTNIFVQNCDIRDADQVKSAVQQALSKTDRIDVLMNVAGIIQVGSIDTMTIDDFDEAMKVHFWGPLFLINELLPSMKKSRGARIVNVSSIGGLVSVPHLTPYCASKYALVGLSRALAEELSRYGISVTTVCPGLMRTGSHVNAYFKGDRHKEEFMWFSASNAAPGLSISAESAASQVIEACRRGTREIVLGAPAQALAKVSALMPGLVSTLLGLANLLLPRSNTPMVSPERFSGWDSRSWLSNLLSLRSDREIKTHNEDIHAA